jgi:hypothetical protein
MIQHQLPELYFFGRLSDTYRNDVRLDLIAQKIQPYCFDPTFPAPEDLGIRLCLLTDEINETKIWSSLWNNSDTNNYEQFEPALCAYAYSSIADKVRQIIQGITSRSGESLRQISFRILGYYLLFGNTEKICIYQAWKKFNSKFKEISDLEELAESHLFNIVLKSMDAGQQIQHLIARSNCTPEQLSIQTSFKPLIISTEGLRNLVNGKTSEQLQRILWFISSSYENLSAEIIKEIIYPLSEQRESTNVRFMALKILYLSQVEEVIRDFVNSPWRWNYEFHYWENHWSSLLLAKYGKDMPYSSLWNRVDPGYLGILIRERGMRTEEVKEFANFIDRNWDEIYNSEIALPEALPFVEIDAISSSDPNMVDRVRRLSDRYSSSSMKSTDRNYQWGGMEPPIGNSPFSMGTEERNERNNNLSQMVYDFFDSQKSGNNRLSSDQVPVDVLIEIVNHCPDLITKWLNPIEPHHSLECAERVVSFCSVFYESLCAALFHLSHHQSVDLYSFLRRKERQITLRDPITNIYFLDSALFNTSATDLIQGMWIDRLKDCRLDSELMEISIAAQQQGKVDWLENYALEQLKSDIPLNLSFGLTLLGFIDTISAGKHLREQVAIQPNSWKKELAKLSLERWNSNSHSKHWFELFLQGSNPDLAWSHFRLFARCVDRRYWLWEKDVVSNISDHPHLNRNLEFLEDNKNNIQNSIRTNEKPHKESFLGQKIQDRQVWPWL